MADVLLARTEGIEGFERHVVLKRIRAEHARDQHFIGMFLDEARVAANLHHQSIVQVNDIGESSGEYFFAMEYIHGEDVRAILSAASKARTHVPLNVVVSIISAAAAGLHYAHERRGPDKRSLGIVHCDVSPSNILVSYDGAVKVVDFGIAKAALRHEETRSGFLKGKVSYMSPEQCQSTGIDRRSDVYSLGVVLYELSTTTRLFKGDNDYLVMDAIVKGKVPLPRVRRPELPNELATIIMRALNADPNRRYQTADELRVALDQFAATAGLVVSPSVVSSYLKKLFGERPEPWLAIAAGRDEGFEEYKSSWSDAPVDAMAHGSSPNMRSSQNMRTAAGSSQRIDVAASTHKSAKVAVGARPDTVPGAQDLGWAPEAAPAAKRKLTPAKIAMIAVPIVALLGVAIWKLSGTGSSTTATAPVATNAAPVAAPAAAPAPAPAVVAAVPAPGAAPVVTPIEPPAPAPVVAAKAPAAAPVARPAVAAAPGKKAAVAKTEPVAAAPVVVVSSSANPSGAPAPATGSAAPASAPVQVAAATPTPAPAPVVAAPTPPTPTPVAPAPAPVAVPAAPAATPPAAVDVATLSQSVINRVASDHGKELSKCEGTDALKGEISVHFFVGTDGRVTKSQIGSAMGKPKLAACILKSLQKWTFAKQPAGGAQGTYTIVFQ